MSKLTLVASLALAAVVAAAVPALAGSAPTLKNEDSSDYSYDLECGAATTHSSVDHNTTVTLRDGCTLKVAGSSKELKSGMTCTIKDGALSCR
ncbi:MAG: hypothetical protein IPL61_07115 [Myxococcales bacterium]|nr:hypothetical protein [Myxococcales bacterium]